jgi:hypothetical protein
MFFVLIVIEEFYKAKRFSLFIIRITGRTPRVAVFIFNVGGLFVILIRINPE